MKKSHLFLVFLIVLLASSVSAQQVGGEWYGVGTVKKAGAHNSYLSEMVLTQKGNKVTGELRYFYRKSEIKTKISGTYDPKYKVLELNARPILNFLAKNQNGADCPMEGSLTLKITKTKTTLSGQFNPTYDYRITCPAIDITFTKASRADNKSKPLPVDDKDDEELAEAIEKGPIANKFDTTKKAALVNNRASSGKTDTTGKMMMMSKPDSVKSQAVIVRPPIIHKPLTEDQKISLALKQRIFEESPIIDVEADTLRVALYDNGEVDNDTISLFYNRKRVKAHHQLNDKGLSILLPLDTKVNEIAMFAENLGTIPPNTALAVIYAGEKRFELILTSTLQKNATLRFRKKVKHFDPKNIN